MGRPPAGPGALAEPGRRPGPRVLDLLVLLPVYVVLAVVTLIIAAPHFGPLLPDGASGQASFDPCSTSGDAVRTPGLVWLYLVILASALVARLVMVAYETILVAAWGRTLGMRWLAIRPLGTDGVPLEWGRSFVRAIVYWLFSLVGWIGLINVLWCLWDEDRSACTTRGPIRSW